MINSTIYNDINNTQLHFSPNLNVILGENGTGKTHLLLNLYNNSYEEVTNNYYRPFFIPSSGVLSSYETRRLFTNGEKYFEFTNKSTGEQTLAFAECLYKNIDDFTQTKILFWDNPDNNLSYGNIKKLLKILCNISNKLQVFITTHNLFLIRELELIDLRNPNTLKFRYFNLKKDKLYQGDSSDDVDAIECLDESIKQSEEYLYLYNEE